jgi:hypothetical protein
MNAFETFLLDFAKGAVAVAPEILPIFMANAKGIAILNVSDELIQAAMSQIGTPAGTPTTAAPAVAGTSAMKV